MQSIGGGGGNPIPHRNIAKEPFNISPEKVGEILRNGLFTT